MSVQTDHNHIKNVYQVTIDKFLEEMNLIDGLYGTYAKIDYKDEKSRPMMVDGINMTKVPYVRRVEIDEINMVWSNDWNENGR